MSYKFKVTPVIYSSGFKYHRILFETLILLPENKPPPLAGEQFAYIKLHFPFLSPAVNHTNRC